MTGDSNDTTEVKKSFPTNYKV